MSMTAIPRPRTAPPSRLRRSLTVELRALTRAAPRLLPDGFAAAPDLRRLLLGEDVSCWTIGGLGLVGFGRAASFAVRGEDRFTGARAWWDELLGGMGIEDPLARSATGPVAFGAFAFARASAAASGLVVPELVIGHDATGAWATLVSHDEAQLTVEDVAEAWRRLVPQPLPPGPFTEQDGPGAQALEDPRAQERWCESVAAGIEEIRTGPLQKLVLARAVPVVACPADHGHSAPGDRGPEGRGPEDGAPERAPGDPDPVAALDIPRALRRLARDYDRCWSYCVTVREDEDPGGGFRGDPAAGRLFGATPERLVRVLDGVVHARVLAGTLERTSSSPATEDERAWAREQLLENAKQRTEHEFAITSLLQGIAAYTDSVRSSSEPFLLELPNVWHLASDVACELRRGPDGSVPSALELVEAVHPTAAVCGTPTATAAEAIARLEDLDRGLYAGPVGWVDSRHNGDFGIALRGGVQVDAASARVHAGCGVVAGSVPADELAETHAKLRPVLAALGAS